MKTVPFTRRRILLAAASGAAACAPGQQAGREGAGAAPTPGLKPGVTLTFAQGGNQALDALVATEDRSQPREAYW